MKVAIACHHAAYILKEEVKDYLQKKGFEVIDFGTHSEESVDYPDTIKQAARAVGKKECEYGIVLCASGVGASIVANKIRGVRAALCLDEYTAEYARRHNNANVMAIAGKRMSIEDAARCLDIWFSTEFEGGRHQRRIDKIDEIEKEECL